MTRRLLLTLLIGLFCISQRSKAEPVEHTVSYLGVVFQSHNNDAYVVGVIDGSPAEQADLRPHDIIVDIDGLSVTVDTLAQVLWSHSPQEIIEVTLQRDEQLIEVSVTLEQRPTDPDFFLKATQPTSTSIPELGIVIEDTLDGLIITGLYDDHKAADHLELGDKLVKIGDWDVKLVADVLALSDRIDASKSLSLDVERYGQHIFIDDLSIQQDVPHGVPANLSIFSLMPGLWRYDEPSKSWSVAGGTSYPSGVIQDDVILTFNGVHLNVAELEAFLYGLSPDETVSLKVLRNGREQDVEALSTTLTNGGTFYTRSNHMLFLPFLSARGV